MAENPFPVPKSLMTLMTHDTHDIHGHFYVHKSFLMRILPISSKKMNRIALDWYYAIMVLKAAIGQSKHFLLYKKLPNNLKGKLKI